MKTVYLSAWMICQSLFIFAQSIPLESFDKIMVSPRINLHLVEGDQENIRFEVENIDPDDIRYEVRHKKLSVFLDGARNTEPQVSYKGYKRSIYAGGEVHAYVTYKSLRKLVVKGEENVTCDSPIDTDRFTMRLYGESEVDLISLNAGYFKVAMFGENDLHIGEGDIDTQRYALYGENDIKVKEVSCHDTRTTSFGENELTINSKNLSLTSFGETEIAYAGSMKIGKKIVLGTSDIRSIHE